MDFINPKNKDKKIKTNTGRNPINSANRSTASQRAINNKLWVNTDIHCPNCGHHKSLETSTQEKCSRCKTILKK